MPKQKTRKAAAQTPTADAATYLTATTALIPLKSFFDGGGEFENFSFGRFYWEAGDGERESIAPRIDKKQHPVRSDSGAVLASAVKVELLLPHDAPQDYMSLDHLIRRYEETLPRHEVNAYAQVTIRFPDAVNLHHPYEMVRAWVRAQYPHSPVIIVLHAPHEWGSSNPGHAHCIVFPRRLGSLGWTAVERTIASDVGQREAYESWVAFREEWADRHASAA